MKTFMSQEAARSLDESNQEVKHSESIPEISQRDSLMWAIAQAARYQGTEVDRLQLHASITKNINDIDNVTTGLKDWYQVLSTLCEDLDIRLDEPTQHPDPARLPAIAWNKEQGWVLIRAQSPNGNWMCQDFQERWTEIPKDTVVNCARLHFSGERDKMSDRPAYQLFKEVFLAHRKPLYEAAIATALISLVQVAISLYSMQVYDRVIPTKGLSTLWVLTGGVLIAMLFDFILKHARLHLSEENLIEMDRKLSREIYARLLKVRLDQLPTSLGSLGAQIRGYESIRTFMSSSTLYFLVDLPFGLVFLVLIALIASPLVVIPIVIFLIIGIIMGVMTKDKIERLSLESLNSSNKKMGQLVETIEGSETIKAGGGAWGMLSKWIDLNEKSIDEDAKLRKTSELGTHVIGSLQQATYIAVVAIGAYLITEGQMTMGSLIATSILSSRVTAPVAMLYQILLRYGTAKAALNGIEAVYRLKMDNSDADRVILLDKINGRYILEDVRFSYQNAPRSVYIPNLKIEAGEKVGVLGAIGSGKSTLLRLLSGMYQPLTGKILIDGVDIGHISRQVLSEQIGYLQQDHRLFNGTLRENLLIGTLDPGDTLIQETANQTGLAQVIANHPKGLDLPIMEGGRGLSGGQKQLTALTRLLISQPSVWLLDEPTASMDQQTADKCMNTLKQAIKPEHTLVLVTHNLQLLSFVDRLIIVANNRIVLDGPRDEVINRLKGGAQGSVAPTATESPTTQSPASTTNP
ncbi:MAG: multidrug transporter ATPase [Burkholderiaceae bacterium]|nr:multidrug transporter ATPase [Burkholderiaceae bacterium]